MGEYGYMAIDRGFRANLARLTLGLSPAVLAEQSFDWLAHLAISPGKQLQLVEKGFRQGARLGSYATQSAANTEVTPCIAPLPQDRRFEGGTWQRWPYNLLYQSFLLTQQWWHSATTGVEGLSTRNQERLSFTVRQFLDMFSPSNFPLTNPEVIEATLEQGGSNLLQGFQNVLEDWRRAVSGKPPLGAEEFITSIRRAGWPRPWFTRDPGGPNGSRGSRSIPRQRFQCPRWGRLQRATCRARTPPAYVRQA
jgi:polyhydroxyalkanoate synthase